MRRWRSAIAYLVLVAAVTFSIGRSYAEQRARVDAICQAQRNGRHAIVETLDALAALDAGSAAAHRTIHDAAVVALRHGPCGLEP